MTDSAATASGVWPRHTVLARVGFPASCAMTKTVLSVARLANRWPPNWAEGSRDETPERTAFRSLLGIEELKQDST